MDQYITVSQFNELINIQLQTIGVVSVVGEITEKNISRNSGLMMTVKDEKENSILKVGGFAPRIKGVNTVDVGMKVVVTGVPQVYGPFGSFSIQAISLTPYGEGSLKAAFEKLKQTLESKGYFAEDRKRKLPQFVTEIALVTAEGSAAYIDFMKIINETNTCLDIDLYPVHVQGKYAVKEMVEALVAASDSEVDAVVLTRGGGSLEDLIAFNDEEIANAVFGCRRPVISAVGHERDTSISDLVADIVASTPSQAAYYLADHNQHYIDSLIEYTESLYDSIGQLLSELDYSKSLYECEQKINQLIKMFDYLDKLRLIEQSVSNMIIQLKRDIESKQTLLGSLNPENVLRRGYAIMKTEKEFIRSISQVTIDDELRIRLVDGKFISRVISIDDFE